MSISSPTQSATAPGSTVQLTPRQRVRCKTILDFWHKVEFFIPFDLEGQILDHKDSGWAVREWSQADLRTIPADSCGNFWHVARVPDGKQLSGFELYLGVFDKSVLGDITQAAASKIGASALSNFEINEQTERSDLEGKTCFAKIRLDACGEPMLDEISVSTAPWALGRVLEGGLACLNFDRFEESLKQLQKDLHNFKATRVPPAASAGGMSAEKRASVRPLTRGDLEALLQLVYAWAGFTPETNGQAQIVVRAQVQKKAKSIPGAATRGLAQTASMAKPSGVRNGRPAAAGEDEDAEEDESKNSGTTIDILNSFYAKDIQRVMRALDDGHIGAAMLAYLAPLLDEDKTDLYGPAGRARILADLHPQLTPRAHWLGEPAHAMSLMQQFAINNTFQLLGRPGMFSVNGPPGTGKTTLLRDIFAENITRRALVLAGFSNAADALCVGARLKVEFEGESRPCYVAPLKSQVSGFEMLVASSNNAAVDNISRDLPKAKALGTVKRDPLTGTAPGAAWLNGDGSPRQTYLREVAHRIAAQNSKGEFDKLSDDDTPWGLISAALGNRSNQKAFANGICFPPRKDGQAPPKGYDPEQHQSLWEWRKQYRGLSFAVARTALVAAHDAVIHRQGRLTALAAIWPELDRHTLASFARRETIAANDAQQALKLAQSEWTTLAHTLQAILSRLGDLKKIHEALQDDRPRWWQRWFKTAHALWFAQQVAQTRQAQRQALREKMTLEPRVALASQVLQAAKAMCAKAQQALSGRHARWTMRRAELSALRLEFPDAARPATPEELESAQWQIDGVWHDEKLNRLRSELFAAALGLQQAWLADVLQEGPGKGPFSQNLIAIGHLLSGKRLADRSQALAIWQSLFLIVPIVSSTFASIANQFRDLEANALGWLFIDEAGQAVPQAAVGAIWRCQRVVVVGDPMQIEPVFTVPIKLIDAVALSSNLPADTNLKPHHASVQNLADAANGLGTWLSGSGAGHEWIGSPLRVHRRCVEPMFGVANAIAYEGKMVHGLALDKQDKRRAEAPDLGASAWVQLAGKTGHRQVVAEHTELVMQALVGLYLSGKALPPLYIISPFKAVKKDLVEHIGDLALWQKMTGGAVKLPGKSALAEWCRKHVGTVHTFQGKEQSMVWLVLGCDRGTEGAVHWASAKPNLLNVAITRAQDRFFVIGDVDLWGGKPFFQTAAARLPRISPSGFQERMRPCQVSLEK